MKPKFRPDGHCTCGHPPQPELHAPGYGVRNDGSTSCIDCLTESQRAALIRDGAGQLRLETGLGIVNEARTLCFDIIANEAAPHNIAKARRDIWFIGPDDMRWQGTRYGEGDGPLHVKRCTGINQLREQLREHGMTLYLKGGEYRVNYRHGADATAEYTTDPLDAFRIGLRMAGERDAPKPIAMGWA